MSIHKIQQFPWSPLFFFAKINLILYPQVRNSITRLTNNEYWFCSKWHRVKKWVLTENICHLIIFLVFPNWTQRWLFSKLDFIEKNRPKAVDLICSDSAHCSYPGLLRLWCEIFGFCLLSFPQNERMIYKLRHLSLSQFVYSLSTEPSMFSITK